MKKSAFLGLLLISFTVYAAPVLQLTGDLDALCKSQISSLMAHKAVSDFQEEVKSLKIQPLEAGYFTAAGTEKWRVTDDLNPIVVFSSESRPFRISQKINGAGETEMQSYIYAIFPDPKNTNGASLGFRYKVKTKLAPAEKIYSYKDNPLDRWDKNVDYAFSSDRFSCADIETVQTNHLPEKLITIRSRVAEEDVATIDLLIRSYVKRSFLQKLRDGEW